MQKKILLLDENHDYIKETLLKLNFQVDEDHTSSKVEIENKISEYDGLVIRSRFLIDQTFLDSASNLEFIARVGAGLENIDCRYTKLKGIHLISAPEGNCDAVGEHAVGMLLSLMNYLNRAHGEVCRGKWIREGNRGHEIMDKTVGIIGYGNMGKAFARRLQGFDCKVICYDIKEDVGDQNASQVDLETLFRETNILSLHTPQTELTLNMINRDFIESFTNNFYLINTARGKSVVTEDLVEALQSGKIIAAGLDVLEYEKTSFENLFVEETPKAFRYLIQADNVLLTPHIAGWTQESKFKLAKTITDKIRQFYNI
ncbi:MAG: 2-hydroxyacid dehydrogenase [Flavobacteriales bacterium]